MPPASGCLGWEGRGAAVSSRFEVEDGNRQKVMIFVVWLAGRVEKNKK